MNGPRPPMRSTPHLHAVAPAEAPAPLPSAADRAKALEVRALAAAAEAVNEMHLPLLEAVIACRGVAGLKTVAPGVRDRASRLADMIEQETAGIELLAGRR